MPTSRSVAWHVLRAPLALLAGALGLAALVLLLSGCGTVSERLPADPVGPAPDGGPDPQDAQATFRLDGFDLGLPDLDAGATGDAGGDGGSDAGAPDAGGDPDASPCEDGEPNLCDTCGPTHPEGASSGEACEPGGFCPDGEVAREGVWRCSVEAPGWYECAPLCPGE